MAAALQRAKEAEEQVAKQAADVEHLKAELAKMEADKVRRPFQVPRHTPRRERRRHAVMIPLIGCGLMDNCRLLRQMRTRRTRTPWPRSTLRLWRLTPCAARPSVRATLWP